MTSSSTNWNLGARAATELALEIEKIEVRMEVFMPRSKSDISSRGYKVSRYESNTSTLHISEYLGRGGLAIKVALAIRRT